METQLEKDLMEAGDRQNGVIVAGTHPDGFHADDVLCAAMLKVEIPHYRWKYIRTRKESLLEQCNITFDVGGGIYDHHGDPIYYPNGVMMAACGKLLNDLYDNWELKDELRKSLLYTIEQQDNGCPLDSGYKLPSNKLACVSAFVPMWNENQSPQSMDAAFEKVVNEIAVPIFSREVTKAYSMISARTQARQAPRICDGAIILLDKYIPWTDVAIADDKIRACIYRDMSNHWRIQMVPKTFGSKELRYALPSRWRGTRVDQAKLVTGIEDAIFVHHTGFLAGFGSRESCIKVAELVCKMKEGEEC